MPRLSSRTALITGAASGIGLAVATRFAREGARVVIADREHDAAAAAADALNAEHGEELALALGMDISQEEQVEQGYATLAEAGWSPDVVIANAGVQLFGQDAKIADLDLDVWQRTLAVNLTGTMLTVKHAVRAMLPAGGGSIIITGSPTGLTGEGNDFTSYATTKAGLHGLTRTVAAAYAADGIRVNAVIPAYTETPLVSTISEDAGERSAIVGRIPLGRAGTPQDVEGVMVFLASDDAAFATGSLFAVDGGMTSL